MPKFFVPGSYYYSDRSKVEGFMTNVMPKLLDSGHRNSVRVMIETGMSVKHDQTTGGLISSETFFYVRLDGYKKNIKNVLRDAYDDEELKSALDLLEYQTCRT
jgi:hypothetical protein